MLKEKKNPVLPFNKWSKVFNMAEAFSPQIYEPNIQGNYVRERQRKQFLNEENSSLMTYYFINIHQSFVKHKNFLGTSNVVSPASCYMPIVFSSQWRERSCFICCLSISFFTHHNWLPYWINTAENTRLTVYLYKFWNVSKGWSNRFLSQSFTRLGRHCKRNLMKVFLLGFFSAQACLF